MKSATFTLHSIKILSAGPHDYIRPENLHLSLPLLLFSSFFSVNGKTDLRSL